MNRPRYKVNEYSAYVQFSKSRRVLVEGEDDRRFWASLFYVLSICRTDVDIDDASILKADGEVLGNRGKVEEVCRAADAWPHAHKFAGFVDREYREFEEGYVLSDRLCGHRVCGRGVWSRGHSVENYFLDYDTVAGATAKVFGSIYFSEALTVLASVFDDVIRLACALGLAGRDARCSEAMRTSLCWKYLCVAQGALRFDAEMWHQGLAGCLSEACADAVLASYRHWKEVVDRSEMSVVRWMCDGHTGFAAVWVAFAAALHGVCQGIENCDPDAEAAKSLSARQGTRFSACAGTWAERWSRESLAGPAEILLMLGFEREAGRLAATAPAAPPMPA
jgi:hypothetical protein